LQGKDQGNVALPQKEKAVPYLIVTSGGTVDKDGQRPELEVPAADAVTHDRSWNHIDRNLPAAASQTPFGIDEIDE
jgi:hypothetical protein